MLQLNPSYRLPINQVLEHPFFDEVQEVNYEQLKFLKWVKTQDLVDKWNQTAK